MKQVLWSAVAVSITWAAATVAHAQAGAENQACYGNGTCNPGLACSAGRICVATNTGTENGPCYGNGTCNPGLACQAGLCAAQGGAAPALGAPAMTYGAPVEVVTERKTWGISARAGFFMGGEIYIEGLGDVDADSGLALAIDADFAVSEKLSIGGFLFTTSTAAYGYDARVSTVGAKIKGMFQAGKVSLRPGIALGYQNTSVDGLSDDATGMDIAALFEVHVPVRPDFAFVGELSFNTQPTGGNNDADVTWGPIFFVTAGIAYGL